MAITLTPRQVLDLPMTENDSGADTIRGYLTALLAEVWQCGEGFSGKHPFGNSGWESDLYAALIKGAAIDGTLDADGYIDTVSYDDEEKGSALILEAIRALA